MMKFKGNYCAAQGARGNQKVSIAGFKKFFIACRYKVDVTCQSQGVNVFQDYRNKFSELPDLSLKVQQLLKRR